MSPTDLIDCIHPEHVSLFEVRIKAIVASSLRVFGNGTQSEEELMSAIGGQSPDIASQIDDAIAAHRDWSVACTVKAPKDIIDSLRETARKRTVSLRESVQKISN